MEKVITHAHKTRYFALSSLEFDAIEIHHRQGENLSNSILFDGPEVFLSHATGTYGSLAFHELQNQNFVFLQCDFKIVENFNLSLSLNHKSLGLYFALKNKFQYRITRVGNGFIGEYQYNLLFLPLLKLKCSLVANEEYTCFNIHFAPDYLEQFIHLIPTLSRFMECMGKNLPVSFRERHLTASADIRTIIQNLLQCPYRGDLKEMYLETKAHELLLLSLSKSSPSNAGARAVLHKSDIQKIHDAKDHLLQHLENPGTLKEIARSTGINEFKLKQGFRQIFGTTVFGMLFEERMQKALVLLRDTDMTIDEVSNLTGYKNHSNFTAAFKKKFGYPPSVLRKF